MYAGDRSRKETLVNYGFSLPVALDNRPLRYEEFSKKINQTIFSSATPDNFEIELSKGETVEQLIRPTGIIDPKIEVRETKNQIENLISEIKNNILKKHKTIVTTLTKRMAEDLTDFLAENNIKVAYVHSDVKTLDRIEIIDNLRRGKYDVIVGINLLREGIDLPEVSLVVIMDADKEGFLRGKVALVQTIGRAARHESGRVIMYADRITESMRYAIDETKRRREKQIKYNTENNIIPKTTIRKAPESEKSLEVAKIKVPKSECPRVIEELKKTMELAANKLEFERAAELRDQIIELENSI
jgi:excinuclease ABC subunit B